MVCRGSVEHLLVQAEQRPLDPLEVQVCVEPGVPGSVQGELPAPPVSLLADLIQVGLDGKHPPLPTATHTAPEGERGGVGGIDYSCDS